MMRRFGRYAAAAVLAVCATAGAAEAGGVLTTMPSSRPDRAYRCLLTNAGTREADVRIEIVRLDGSFSQYLHEAIPPGGMRSLTAGDEYGNNDDTLHCRFVILKGSKKDIRAGACLLETAAMTGPCHFNGEAR